ncbi:MAG: hypothetical protein FJZ58_06035 [Chlamydiae bacterium]|nr:hypothetical protein [Chlamydiota bacterium]
MEPMMATRKNYSPEEYKLMSRCVNEIVDQLAEEMYKNFGLLCSAQGGSMPYDIESIGVEFTLHQCVSIEEARELEVKVTERFVEIVNAHEAVRPYLRDYPWDHKRAEVMLAFYAKDGKYYYDGLSLVLQAHDDICYFAPDTYSPTRMHKIKEEPYIEAKEIVDTSPSCLKPFIVPKKRIFFRLFWPFLP